MDKTSLRRLSTSVKKMAFLSVVYVIIIYLQSDVTDSGSRIKDQPGDLIHSIYDFIIVVNGSAGKNNTY